MSIVDNLHEMSNPKETINMKYRILLSGKILQNVVCCNLPSMLSVDNLP